MKLLRSAFVIGRRDFTATVMSKTFLLFLLGPLFPAAMGIMFGSLGERMAREDDRSGVAVISAPADFAAIKSAHSALAPQFAQQGFPTLAYAAPASDVAAQTRELLADKDKEILAVLTGGLDAPKLTGSIGEGGSIRRHIGLVLDQARKARALEAAGTTVPPVRIALDIVDSSAGSVATGQAITARLGQLLLFMLTLLLAVQLLSNLIEEKSNKVIEILAAAVPVDAIFLGKLFAMLAMSVLGISVWAIAAAIGIRIWLPDAALPMPAVGWPAFVALAILYFTASYLLLGGLFLGIGSQAATVREVQTLSMPVTMGQVAIFGFASFAVGNYDEPAGLAAAIFPFSSPFTMIARAAEEPALWPHLLALGWQALWVALIIRFAAGLFRRSVLKSGGSGPWWKLGRSTATT